MCAEYQISKFYYFYPDLRTRSAFEFAQIPQIVHLSHLTRTAGQIVGLEFLGLLCNC